MSIAPYSHYRPSGVEWLGDIPAHWQVQRLKRACEIFPSNVDKKTVEGETPVQLCNYTDVYRNDVITPDIEFMAATATPEQIARFTLCAGDTIITKDSETADDIAVSAFVPDAMPGVVCGYHLSMIRPRGAVDGRFVKRLFDAAYTKARVAVQANGLTRVGLGQYALDNLELPFPPFAEQRAVAAFLDRETAKIDGLVAEQQRLMAVLREKRQTVIAQAVTKGLHRDAIMKQSGVEWLGDVPRHWAVVRLRRLLASVDYGISDSLSPEGDIAVLRMGNIKGGKVVMDDLKYTHAVPDELLLTTGDLLYNRTNSLDQIAKVGRFTSREGSAVSFASYLVRLRANGHADSRYLALLLNTEGILGVARASAFVSIGQCNLNPARYGELKLPLPPIEEQREIVDFLNHELRDIDTLTHEASVAVKLLAERRIALVGAAVTGQIDVRGLATAGDA